MEKTAATQEVKETQAEVKQFKAHHTTEELIESIKEDARKDYEDSVLFPNLHSVADYLDTLAYMLGRFDISLLEKRNNQIFDFTAYVLNNVVRDLRIINAEIEH